MEVQTYHFDIAHLRGFLHNGQHVAHVDAKLVLGKSGGEVCMGMSPHIGIQAEGYTGNLPLGSSQLVDNLQLGDALHVEAEDVVVQAKVNLPVALTNACIDDALAGETGLDAGFYLAAADTVDTQACLTDNLQHLGVRIGLDGIVHAKALMFAYLLSDGAKRLSKQFRIVIVEGRLYAFQFF